MARSCPPYTSMVENLADNLGTDLRTTYGPCPAKRDCATSLWQRTSVRSPVSRHRSTNGGFPWVQSPWVESQAPGPVLQR